MNSHLQEAKFNGGALVDIARKYGIQISAYQKADKALLSLAKQMKGFSLETKTAIMSQLGLDEAMQRALIDGGAELERQIQKQKALGVETDEDIKLTKDFNEAMLDLKDIFSALAREMMRGIMPFLRGLVDKMIFFVDILRKNEIFVKGFFIGITIALMPILAILAKMAIATLTAFAPFIAIGVAVAGVAAIFEDLYYYFMGWDSATGELVKKFPHLKKVIDPLKPVIMGIMNVFSKIWALIKNPSWRAFGDTLKSIFTLPMDALQTLAEGLKSWFDSLGQIPAALTTENMDLGTALKSIRKELKVSRVELAKRSDLSVTALYNIENNISFPPKETIEKLCGSLHIPVSYLMLYSLTEDDVPDDKREFFKLAVGPVKAFLMGK